MVQQSRWSLIYHARSSGTIPEEIYQRIANRFQIITNRIERNERATRIKYPTYYVIPELVLSSSSLEYGRFGIFFARTIPTLAIGKKLNILVQITVPTVALGLVGTVCAILAQEFLHYLELLDRIIKVNMVSGEICSTMFEEKYADYHRLIKPGLVFGSDHILIRHISKRFNDRFRDNRVENKAIKDWINNVRRQRCDLLF